MVAAEVSIRRQREKLPSLKYSGNWLQADVAANFLEAHGVSFKPASASSQLDLASIADKARQFTLLIVCQ